MSKRECKRVFPSNGGYLTLPNVDCYGKDKDGMWYFRLEGHHGGTLEGSHEVTEHEDGTISVRPSIAGIGFHGYLTKGVWEDC
jgi:hypothetical protein